FFASLRMTNNVGRRTPSTPTDPENDAKVDRDARSRVLEAMANPQSPRPKPGNFRPAPASAKPPALAPAPPPKPAPAAPPVPRELGWLPDCVYTGEKFEPGLAFFADAQG